MSFVTADGNAGRQIGAAAQRDPAFGDLSVRLPADGVAHAWLQIAQAGNYPASACQPMTAHWLRVFPPGDTAAAYVGVSFGTCAAASAPLLTVTPVRSGQGVRGVTPSGPVASALWTFPRGCAPSATSTSPACARTADGTNTTASRRTCPRAASGPGWPGWRRPGTAASGSPTRTTRRT